MPLRAEDTASGTGALSALFHLDLSDAEAVARFVNEFSGLGQDFQDMLYDQDDLGADGSLPATLDTPSMKWHACLKRRAPSVREHFEAHEQVLTAVAGVWFDAWLQRRRWEPRAPMFDQRMLRKRPFGRGDADAAVAQMSEVFGIDESRFTIPVGVVAFDLRELQVHLCATLLTQPRADPMIRHTLESAVRDLIDGSDVIDGIFEAPSWLELLLPTLQQRAHEAAASTFRRFQPCLTGPPIEPFFSVEDFLWVELFNDISADFAPKLCANTACRTPFTRQVGQSRHGQSRRDAKACSKSCADRLTYLRRRQHLGH